MALLFPFLQAATLVALFGWLAAAAAPRGVCPVRGGSPRAVRASLLRLPDRHGRRASLLRRASSSARPSWTRSIGRTAFAARLTRSRLLPRGLDEERRTPAPPRPDFFSPFSRSGNRGRPRARPPAAIAPAGDPAASGRAALEGEPSLPRFRPGLPGPHPDPELLPRAGEAVRTGLREVILPAWPGLLCIVLLAAAGRHARGRPSPPARLDLCARLSSSPFSGCPGPRLAHPDVFCPHRFRARPARRRRAASRLGSPRRPVPSTARRDATLAQPLRVSSQGIRLGEEDSSPDPISDVQNAIRTDGRE